MLGQEENLLHLSKVLHNNFYFPRIAFYFVISGAFSELLKLTIRSVMLVSPFVRVKQLGSHQMIFMKFDI
jgi:hypothetical protein